MIPATAFPDISFHNNFRFSPLSRSSFCVTETEGSPAPAASEPYSNFKRYNFVNDANREGDGRHCYKDWVWGGKNDTYFPTGKDMQEKAEARLRELAGVWIHAT